MTHEQMNKLVELLDSTFERYKQYKEIGAKSHAKECHDWHSGVYMLGDALLALEQKKIVCDDGKHRIEEV
jgi:hypothetical protein